MKLIILAAGEGIRLRPYTNNKPKCMVEYNKKPIIDYILSTATNNKVNNVVIVTGYAEEVLQKHLHSYSLKFHSNPRYNTTNMLASLFCAEEDFNEDIIISYADIIYKDEVLQQLIKSEAPFSVVVDKNWKELWSIRMENPLADAETLKVNADGNISELGKKAISYDEIEGQYIGLIKIKKEALDKIKMFYHALDKNLFYDGKNFDNMYMTSFIQLIIDKLMPVKPVFINGGWMEIDSVEDLKNYEKVSYQI